MHVSHLILTKQVKMILLTYHTYTKSLIYKYNGLATQYCNQSTYIDTLNQQTIHTNNALPSNQTEINIVKDKILQTPNMLNANNIFKIKRKNINNIFKIKFL
jgi:hypothetical protein